jgi:hypothetical protein
VREGNRRGRGKHLVQPAPDCGDRRRLDVRGLVANVESAAREKTPLLEGERTSPRCHDLAVKAERDRLGRRHMTFDQLMWDRDLWVRS